jgi:hypothetical protein
LSTDDVDSQGVGGATIALGNKVERREMQDDLRLGLGNCLQTGGAVGDVHPFEPGNLTQGGGAPLGCRKIVKNNHLMTMASQLVAKGKSDIAGSACYEYSQFCSLPIV